jgi:hypothetical protein
MKYDRRTLMINFCGLALAFVLAAENIYINNRTIGWTPAADIWPGFIPVVVMFLIGRRSLSYMLFIIYTLMALYIGFIALIIYFDLLSPNIHVLKGLGVIQGIFIAVLPLILFAIYLVVGITRWAIRHFNSASKAKR